MPCPAEQIFPNQWSKWPHRPVELCAGRLGQHAATGQQACRHRTSGGWQPRRETRARPVRVHSPPASGAVANAGGARHGPSAPVTAHWLPRDGGRLRATLRCPALARRARADPPAGGLVHRNTNVCSNQEGFPARLHMCSNYLHVSGSSWPPARIRSYLSAPSKRCQVQLPHPPGDGPVPCDRRQPAARRARRRCLLRPARAASQGGRPDRRRDGEIPATKILTDAGHPARARGAGGCRPRRKLPVDHRPLALLKQMIRTIFVTDRSYSGSQTRKGLAQGECEG